MVHVPVRCLSARRMVIPNKGGWEKNFRSVVLFPGKWDEQNDR